MRVAIVNTHPIQYFAPVYEALAGLGRCEVEVVYLSRRGVAGTKDAGFGVAVAWDVPLLEGYRSTFTRCAEANSGLEPQELRTDGLDEVLARCAPDVVVVHGYSGRDSRAALGWARRAGVKVVMRGDTWSGGGEVSGGARRLAKRAWLRALVMPRVAACFAVGTRNAAYWAALGVPASRIFPVPYGVDGRRFRGPREAERREARRALGVGDELVVAFTGKLEEKKGLSRLLGWWREAGLPPLDAAVVVVGDGPQREAVEALLPGFGRSGRVTGFVNQAAMPGLLWAADLLLMPSTHAETWGFAAHEALACGLPVAVSDAVGCAPDLVDDGANGWVLPAGEWATWGARLPGLLAQVKARAEGGVPPPFRRPPSHVDAAAAFASALESVA